MAEHRLTPLQIHAFARHLLLEEKSAATIEKYLRNVRAFAGWLDGQENREELVRALQRAQRICGTCGCDLDSLYPKALRLLEIV